MIDQCEALEPMESVFVQILHWLCIVIEAAAALWVSVGFVCALAKLGITAAVRTGLNYFLSKEISGWYDEERDARVVTNIEAPFQAGPRPAQA